MIRSVGPVMCGLLAALALLGSVPNRALGQVPNDTCASAEAVALDTPVVVDTLSANNEGEAGSCFFVDTTGVVDVWYSVAIPEAAQYTISTCAGVADTQLAVYSGDCTTGLVEVGCNDDACAELQAELVLDLLAETYYIQVSGWGSFETVVTELIVASPNINDTCDNAFPIALDTPESFDTAAGHDEGATASCFGPAGGHIDLWWSYTAPADTTLHVDTCSGAADTQIAVYEGPCGSLVELGCNQDSCGTASAVTFAVTAGTSYFIQVSSQTPGSTVASSLLLTNIGAPSNETCLTAQPISTGVVTPFDTTFAVNEGNAASCFYTEGGVGVIDLWYSMTATSANLHIASTCAGLQDTQLAVYLADCAIELGCSDDACPQFASEVSWLPIVGETYFIQVSGWGQSTVSSELLVTDTAVFAPANDACAGAIDLSVDSITPIDTTLASDEAGFEMSCGFGPNLDVWYRIVPPCDGDLDIDLCGASFDTRMAVYTGFLCPIDASTEIACNDDSCGLQSQILLPVTAGATYFLRIGGFNGSSGTGELVLSAPLAPAEDDCASALPVTDGSITLGTECASASGIDPGCGGSTLPIDQWYEYTASCDGLVLVDTEGTPAGDTRLAVYDGSPGCPVPGATPIACDDDGGSGLLSALGFLATAGQSYLIQVGGFGDSVVPFGAQLNISCQPASTQVLVLDHGSALGTAASAAATAGASHVVATDEESFALLLGSLPWDVVVVDSPSQLLSAATVSDLEAYVAGGGRAIVSYWNLDMETSLGATLGVSSAADPLAPQEVSPTVGQETHPVWDGPTGAWTSIPVGLPSTYADHGDDLTAAPGATELGTFAAGSGAAAIVLANENRTLTNGWLGDEMEEAIAVPVIANEISYLLTSGPPQTLFDRGDSNADGGYDIGDPVHSLSVLFSGAPAPTCVDAADANDDGAFDIGDPVYSLSALFASGALPPAPHGACGVDPTADAGGGDLGCDSFAPCP